MTEFNQVKDDAENEKYLKLISLEAEALCKSTLLQWDQSLIPIVTSKPFGHELKIVLNEYGESVRYVGYVFTNVKLELLGDRAINLIQASIEHMIDILLNPGKYTEDDIKNNE